jgi:flagellar biosynthetic protein FlhB
MSDDAASRTEDPTPRRLEQAREKGEVVKTPDLPAVASLSAVASVIALGGGAFANHMVVALKPFLAEPETMVLAGQGGMHVLYMSMMAAAPPMGAVFFAACAAGVAANVIQTGFAFSPNRLAIDFSKLSPMKGFKRVFGLDGAAQFFKSLVKVSLTALLAWWVLKPHLPELENLSGMEPIAMMGFAADILRRLVFAVAVFLLVVAGADWFWQRHRFMSRLRMSKAELKEDHKTSEGDPHVKARQRQLRNQRSRRRMIQAVPDATVVVMNPTHYAVALKYDASETPAPMCVAKGMDTLALKIREIAEAAGVPVIEDPPLARALYAAVDVDEVIPPAHYEAVAKVIGFILNAGRKAAARTLRSSAL